MTFTGTDVDLPRLADCAFGVTAGPAERPVAARLVDDLGGRVVWVDEQQPDSVPRGAGAWRQPPRDSGFGGDGAVARGRLR